VDVVENKGSVRLLFPRPLLPFWHQSHTYLATGRERVSIHQPKIPIPTSNHVKSSLACISMDVSAPSVVAPHPQKRRKTPHTNNPPHKNPPRTCAWSKKANSGSTFRRPSRSSFTMRSRDRGRADDDNADCRVGVLLLLLG
jgi:hypothetical protein